jgi:hypothetical protein
VGRAAPDRDKVQLLLDAGADVNARSDEGRSGVSAAATGWAATALALAK